jgi:hypothetical protein
MRDFFQKAHFGELLPNQAGLSDLVFSEIPAIKPK